VIFRIWFRNFFWIDVGDGTRGLGAAWMMMDPWLSPFVFPASVGVLVFAAAGGVLFFGRPHLRLTFRR